MMHEAADVLVAIPAHNEADSIRACLTSVVNALRIGQQAGAIRRARVAVAAHRCSDDTVERCHAVLDRLPLEFLVWSVADELPVGAVRTRLIQRAAQASPALPDSAWVLSTDADTVVPDDWACALIAIGRDTGADLVLGLAELDSWRADGAAQGRSRELIDAAIDDGQHGHAYAANLAVRWSTFRAVGGFPAVPHGEEHALAAEIRRTGGRVVSPLQPRVRTSARMPGRAEHGLGALLARLASGS